MVILDYYQCVSPRMSYVKCFKWKKSQTKTTCSNKCYKYTLYETQLRMLNTEYVQICINIEL